MNDYTRNMKQDKLVSQSENLDQELRSFLRKEDTIILIGLGNEFRSDDGAGIPPEIKPRLFDPYFSTKKTGTGLGLSIVASIISDHHGYVRIRENDPKGTIFRIELPIGA